MEYKANLSVKIKFVSIATRALLNDKLFIAVIVDYSCLPYVVPGFWMVLHQLVLNI